MLITVDPENNVYKKNVDTNKIIQFDFLKFFLKFLNYHLFNNT